MELFLDTLWNAGAMTGNPVILLMVFLGVIWGCAAGATPGLT